MVEHLLHFLDDIKHLEGAERQDSRTSVSFFLVKKLLEALLPPYQDIKFAAEDDTPFFPALLRLLKDDQNVFEEIPTLKAIYDEFKDTIEPFWERTVPGHVTLGEAKLVHRKHKFFEKTSLALDQKLVKKGDIKESIEECKLFTPNMRP